MGFLDSLVGEEGKGPEKGVPKKSGSQIPFRLSSSFIPLRLTAQKANSVNVVLKLRNITDDKQLVSIDILLPREKLLGFDPACISKSIEKRVGEVGPGQSVEVSVPIWANNQTAAGDYAMNITAYAHYQDYNKVYASVQKLISLRAV